MATTTVEERVRDYFRFRIVLSKRERVAVWILTPVVLIIILMFWGIPPLDIIPAWGPSMQPTLVVWNIPEPWERFSFSGWVHYDPEVKPEIGNIVYFRIPNTRVYEVKRVTKINDAGELWVKPDNTGVSGEGSDNSDIYSWVNPNWVIGVVDSACSLSRTLHWFSERGRSINKLSLMMCPEWRIDGGSLDTVTYAGGGQIRVFSLSPLSVIYRDEFDDKRRVGATYRNARLVYPVGQLHEYGIYDPKVGDYYRFHVTAPERIELQEETEIFVAGNNESISALAKGEVPVVSVDGKDVALKSFAENDWVLRTKGRVFERRNCFFALMPNHPMGE